MENNIKNIIIIAQKEFADHIWSLRFLGFAITFTLIVCNYSPPHRKIYY